MSSARQTWKPNGGLSPWHRRRSSDDLQALAAIYQTASASLASVNQSRWSLISNYLLANSFLLVAWVTVFAWEPGSGSTSLTEARAHILFGLGTLGFVISVLWLKLVMWMNPYVHIGQKSCEGAEKRLLKGFPGSSCNKTEWAKGGWLHSNSKCQDCDKREKCYRTYMRARHYQEGKSVLSAVAGTSEVMLLVPVMFLLLYIGALVKSEGQQHIAGALFVLAGLGTFLVIMGSREIPKARQVGLWGAVIVIDMAVIISFFWPAITTFWPVISVSLVR